MAKLSGRFSDQAMRSKRAKNFARWLVSAKKKHGSRFSYDNLLPLEYVGQKATQITLICSEHGEFTCSAYDHLRYAGGGCPACAERTRSRNRRQSGRRKFMDWFEHHREDRLELLTDYQGMTQSVTVRCKSHGIEKTLSPSVLMGTNALGCDLCAREAVSKANRWTLEKLIGRYENDLPEHVTIVGVRFDEERRQSMITVHCKEHGNVEMLKATFAQSQYKCTRCGDESTGYAGYRMQRLLERDEEGRDTWVGLMEVEVYGIRSLKVGITSRSLEDRYKWHLKKIFFSAKMKEIDALVLENQIHREFREIHDRHILAAGMRTGERWAGDTECYDLEARTDIERFIKEFIRLIRKTKPDYWAEFKLFERPEFREHDTSREKSSLNAPKRVVCVETGEYFDSIQDAQRAKNAHSISTVLSNPNRTIAGGYRWVTAEDYEAGKIPKLRPRRVKRKAVVCVDTGERWDSIAEAERQTGIRHIHSVVSGKRHTAGGKHWIYADDSDS